MFMVQHFICRYFEEKKLKRDVSEITGNVIEVTMRCLRTDLRRWRTES